MQPIDALTLQLWAWELDTKLADCKINKIQQANHYELLIHCWAGGETGRQKLYFNIRPQSAVVLIAPETDFLAFPKTPPNFCIALRKHLSGAPITSGVHAAL